MKVLTLSIKREWFDKILAGEKDHEYREVTPKSGGKYINYILNGQIVPFNYDGEIAIKFLTGAYSGKRPWALVEVKSVEHQFLFDEDGKDVFVNSAVEYTGNGAQVRYVLSDEEDDYWLVQRMDYTLGKVLDKNLNPE